MTDCPYCGGGVAESGDANHPRPSDQQLVQCQGCAGYSVRRRGKSFPMEDRTNPDSGAVNRVTS